MRANLFTECLTLIQTMDISEPEQPALASNTKLMDSKTIIETWYVTLKTLDSQSDSTLSLCLDWRAAALKSRHRPVPKVRSKLISTITSTSLMTLSQITKAQIVKVLPWEIYKELCIPLRPLEIASTEACISLKTSLLNCHTSLVRIQIKTTIAIDKKAELWFKLGAKETI